MSIIGIDFGSHTASIAVWHEDKNLVDVIADDLGYRAIPTIVAYRNEEIIVGQSAIAQQLKNAANTFEDVRSLIVNSEAGEKKFIAAIEKEVSVEEIASHAFRNIQNQVKQQLGKLIRDAVVTVPDHYTEEQKKKIQTAAQLGGIRIKSFIPDTRATLVGYGLIDPSNVENQHTARSLVIDLGWTSCSISIFATGGNLVAEPLASVSTDKVSVSTFVKALQDFCAKEFNRKAKISCADNKRAMTRLARECEAVVKTLSTNAEATIDIDSLYEGIDYSSKISRARFEDLLSIPIIQFKQTLQQLFTEVSEKYDSKLGGVPTSYKSISHVLLSGGGSSIPKINQIIKTLFPESNIVRSRFENSEMHAVGAVTQAKNLYTLQLIEKVPTQSIDVPSLNKPIYISSSSQVKINADGTTSAPVKEIFSVGSPLPLKVNIPLKIEGDSEKFSLFYLVGPKAEEGDLQAVAEVAVPKDAVSVVSKLDATEGLKVEVLNAAKEVLVSLNVTF